MTAAPDLRRQFPPSRRTLPHILQAQAERYGEATFLRCGETLWSYARLRDEAAAFAGRLAVHGIVAGDRVAIMCGNRPEFLAAFLGCGWLGAVSVPINVASRGFQLQHILTNCGARLLVIEAALAEALTTLDLAALALEAVWVLDAAAPDRTQAVPCVPIPAAAAPVPVPVPVPAPACGPGDMMTILYTSGTTGLSKGVCCPHAQYFWWGYHVAHMLETHEGDVLHTTLPLFHTNALGTVFHTLLIGGSLVVEKRFSVSNFWSALVESGATITFVLGAMVPMLLSREPQPAERAHKVRAALAPGVPAHLHAVFTERTGIHLLDGYGATESNAVIGTTMQTLRPGAMGKLLEGFAARVVDADDEPMPDGEPGELVLRADEPFAFASGYFGMAAQTVEVWRNLWLHTGDRVVRDAEGYYRFLDRMKDSIRRRGENISSFEVEQVLVAHPAVATAAAFPVRSDLAEDEVMVALVLKPGTSVTGAALIEFCGGRMPYFAVPRYIDFVDDMPRTESGKIQKFKLRERGRSPTTWDRDAEGIVVKR